MENSVQKTECSKTCGSLNEKPFLQGHHLMSSIMWIYEFQNMQINTNQTVQPTIPGIIINGNKQSKVFPQGLIDMLLNFFTDPVR